jgi:hypothetical protein
MGIGILKPQILPLRGRMTTKKEEEDSAISDLPLQIR